ncbi:MAG: hypothetical protein FWD66_01730 [Paludibacter sp.]|nr:hypothetical protein [Paludibacter sp.]
MKYINEKDKYESPQVEIEEIMLVDKYCTGEEEEDGNDGDISSIGKPDFE